jgi:cell wall-associated NlpC family hydrolase
MVKRIIWSAVISLALILGPNLAHAVPTKSIKKTTKKSIKKKSSKPQARVAKKSKSSHRSKYSRSRSSRNYSRHHRRHTRRVVRSSMVPRYHRSYVAETPPLMKVIPQRDGKFLLEPLTAPKKTPNTPLSQPAHKAESNDRVSSASHGYNKFEPWDFSQLVLSRAKAYRHAPYALGASLETGSATDCSGFVQFIYHGFKINLPRSSAEQAQVGKVVTRRMDFSKMLPGDILFFRRGGHVGHAGIYLGEGKMIHASNHRNGVTITDLREPYYENTFVVAKRVFTVQYPQ